MTRTLHAKRLPKDNGVSGWQAILPTVTHYPELETNTHADIVVIGAGFAGLSAAHRLAQLDSSLDIVVLEASRLGLGPAGRNSGFMIDLPHELNSKTYAGSHDADHKQIRMNRMAIDFAQALAHTFEMPKSVFAREGKYTAGTTAKGCSYIDSYCEHLKALNEPFQLLQADDLKKLTGIDYYQKGIYTQHAAMVQPAAYIHALGNGLTQQNIRLFENSPALDIQLGNTKTIKTPKGQIQTPKIIFAVNGHIQSFGFCKSQLMHVMLYGSMTRALSKDEVSRLGGQADWGIVPADPMGSTVRKISDDNGSGHRIIVRNKVTLNQNLEASDAQIAQSQKEHEQAFAARFPMLKNVSMEYCWSGRLCMTLNSVPVFGEIEDGVFSANCQNGLGVAKGTLSGILAAEHAILGETEHVKDFLAYDSPKRLPPEPFLSVGANLTMKWKEFLAGREK